MSKSDAELEAVIEAGSRVTLNFSLALLNGEIIDSNFENPPAAFRIGDGSMLPGFEQELFGLTKDAEFQKTVPSENAFGEVNAENVQRFPLDKFRHLLENDLVPTEVGSVISFQDPGGFDLPGVIKKLTAQEVVVDFNHPLAGKDIVFKVKIVSVLPPDAESVEVKV